MDFGTGYACVHASVAFDLVAWRSREETLRGGFRAAAFGSAVVGMVGGSSQLLVRQSFSQEYELEADAAGWDYLVAAKMDPRALSTMLRKLDQEQQIFSKIPGLKEPGAFSSHPGTEKRIRRLDAKWRKHLGVHAATGTVDQTWPQSMWRDNRMPAG